MMNDQSVNEAINGTQVMLEWLVRTSPTTDTVRETADVLRTAVPSPMRNYQSAMEGLAVLDAFVAQETSGVTP